MTEGMESPPPLESPIAEAVVPQKPFPWVELAVGVWIAVSFGLLFRSIVRVVRFRGALRFALPAEAGWQAEADAMAVRLAMPARQRC